MWMLTSERFNPTKGLNTLLNRRRFTTSIAIDTAAPASKTQRRITGKKSQEIDRYHSTKSILYQPRLIGNNPLENLLSISFVAAVSAGFRPQAYGEPVSPSTHFATLLSENHFGNPKERMAWCISVQSVVPSNLINYEFIYARWLKSIQ